jgi:hypothetical protein
VAETLGGGEGDGTLSLRRDIRGFDMVKVKFFFEYLSEDLG